ncbi:glycoprotein 3-alpha-L-fucosyltransferase A-like isoform X2 [Anthonomus grandis grandis]|nr:glycoprotein 3-alpha-L-fucosyltransferase A-like isoform X2 [Anthonomus grandis grandis]XP_050298600.1 glycoprotein 3-alpha-L-fucosyltransferase A-like isoform X2 [Anthonomus grandis grandis]XP_050298601.1 glycoprotein 3-alpha-L-fucosyltransferase A-like isoform X2 [Anthonomus grandis grandis]XP_050298602.1 glycoprotein 3-alpha-L-fucosyltransferase A-like isoform X2 [Anthonomus grandis grandis]XP_050298603.1 glycoprotein 3-alpha-L-fucosyltransferase A-like isoform X2 [Anthonomus grandis gran
MIGVIQKKNFPFILVAGFLFTLTFIILSSNSPREELLIYKDINEHNVDTKPLDRRKVEEWWALRNSSGPGFYSKLGEILFLNMPEPKINSTKKYQILVWKHGSVIENRHLKQYSDQRIDPFQFCSVNNCNITYKDTDLKTADIVIFHLHRTKSKDELPKERNADQIWAFLTDESPYHTFLNSGVKLKDFNGIFNWSMSYRMDTDIPVPYGRTVLRAGPTNPQNSKLLLSKRRDVLVAILGSNCGGQNHRWQYVHELEKYITVHIYGGCSSSTKKCPGHFRADCPAINDYLFYLSFENSNCDEYITEKLWWNAFNKNSIPIVMGSSPSTYKKILPVNSFINVDDFANPRALAQYLLRLNTTGEFKRYHDWRNDFEVLNEHGYFQSRSYHYCRICEALNYNSKESKVYKDLEKFWSVKRDCHPPWNTWNDG